MSDEADIINPEREVPNFRPEAVALSRLIAAQTGLIRPDDEEAWSRLPFAMRMATLEVAEGYVQVIDGVRDKKEEQREEKDRSNLILDVIRHTMKWLQDSDEYEMDALVSPYNIRRIRDDFVREDD